MRNKLFTLNNPHDGAFTAPSERGQTDPGSYVQKICCARCPIQEVSPADCHPHSWKRILRGRIDSTWRLERSKAFLALA